MIKLDDLTKFLQTKFLQPNLEQNELVIFEKLNFLIYGGTLYAQILSAKTTEELTKRSNKSAGDLMVEIWDLQCELVSAPLRAQFHAKVQRRKVYCHYLDCWYELRTVILYFNISISVFFTNKKD